MFFKFFKRKKKPEIRVEVEGLSEEKLQQILEGKVPEEGFQVEWRKLADGSEVYTVKRGGSGDIGRFLEEVEAEVEREVGELLEGLREVLEKKRREGRV